MNNWGYAIYRAFLLSIRSEINWKISGIKVWLTFANKLIKVLKIDIVHYNWSMYYYFGIFYNILSIWEV